MSTKVVLCRPAGGLNDMLCQIGKTIRYALKYRRYTVVDTNFHTENFNDVLSYYLRPNLDAIILPKIPGTQELDGLDVFPSFLKGRLNAYSVNWDDRAAAYVEKETRQPITFDFDKDYDEALLVHDNAGGGMDSFYALGFFTLQPHLRDALLHRFRAIGGAYDAVHIRHSDYKTDYKNAFASIKHKFTGEPIFVATDSSEVMAYCRCLLGDDNVFSFSRFFANEGKPLHYQQMTIEDTRARNVEAFLDLLTLASARNLYVFPIQFDQPWPVYSGFSNLAKALSENHKVLDSLIGKPLVPTACP